MIKMKTKKEIEEFHQMIEPNLRHLYRSPEGIDYLYNSIRYIIKAFDCIDNKRRCNLKDYLNYSRIFNDHFEFSFKTYIGGSAEYYLANAYCCLYLHLIGTNQKIDHVAIKNYKWFKKSMEIKPMHFISNISRIGTWYDVYNNMIAIESLFVSLNIDISTIIPIIIQYNFDSHIETTTFEKFKEFNYRKINFTNNDELSNKF